MTLYGVGLGPGDADLVTVRGRQVLESAEVVYSPGRLSRSVATEYVPESRIGDLDFPMTRDEDELREAWKEAAEEIAPRARENTVAFVTLGDPNVYSTFGHLQRTLSAFHAAVAVEIVPGVSAVTAFTTALGIEVAAGASLTLHEAARGAAPTGPDRMVLFKVTDVPATHERLIDADYDVVYGRRLYMEQGETVVTNDPEALAERDYYTLAYAEKRDLNVEPATATFETAKAETAPDAGAAAKPDGGSQQSSDGDREFDGGREVLSDVVRMERAEGETCGDEFPEVVSR
jgi:precorrin-2/cobalt-factor-2 C20-methyltransferase